MRVTADSTLLSVEPGAATALTLDVVNTEDVIAGVSASVIGLSDQFVSAVPALLPLFPEASGRVRLDLAVPQALPAGRHPLTVQVVSHGASGPPDYLDVDLDVATRPGLRVAARPRIVHARRSGRFVLDLVNTGNVALDVVLSAQDPDRQVQVTFTPDRRRIEPGAAAPIMLTLRGPRMITGAEVERNVAIRAHARPAYRTGPAAELPPAPVTVDGPTQYLPPVPPDVPFPDAVPDALVPATAVAPAAAAGAEPEAAGEDLVVVRDTSVRLKQKPLMSRGLLTVFVLLGIVAMWALIFLLGLAHVFASDPVTKQAPASFFASSPGGATGNGNGGGADGNGGGSGAGGAGGGGNGGGAAPAGALSKSGQVPPGTGGAINGKVVSRTDQQPVGRVLVTAYRKSRTGLRQMSSAATQADGTYTLAGLFPTSYYIKFGGPGLRTTWFPNVPAPTGAQQIAAVAQGSTDGIDATITGTPATISGKVDPGDTTQTPNTTVTARPLLGARTGQAVASAHTAADGSYTLRNLPAPASYELTFTTSGYQANTLDDMVGGGDKRLEPTITLGASTGQIAGTVTDNGNPLGGAKVTTTIGGKAYTVGTPTTGAVGRYVLGNLPTPATYVVTVSSPRHGSHTQIVDLTAGQSKSNINVALDGSSGTVTGKVVDADGKPVGGAGVSVGGAALGASGALSTTTLTQGEPGAFVINGLTNGTYTLSVTRSGYATATVPVTISNGSSPKVTVRLADRLGSIAGRVRGPGGGIFAGATITVRNAQRSWTTTSSTASGSYIVDDLGPGTYSVTVTAQGHRQQTALVTVSAGKTAHQNLKLGS